MKRYDPNELIRLRDSHFYDSFEMERAQKYRELDEFKKVFSRESLKTMKIEDYVQGLGSNDSFCYHIERTFGCFGNISSSSAYKFGIFFSKSRSVWNIWEEISYFLAARVTSPACIFERLSIETTSRERRLTSFETIVRYSPCCSFGIVPSRIPSIKPLMVVIGVFNSWDTFATKLRLEDSNTESAEAIRLNELQSSANSSEPLT